MMIKFLALFFFATYQYNELLTAVMDALLFSYRATSQVDGASAPERISDARRRF
jgi:hypothetical protein